MSVRHASRSVVDALPLSRPSAYICRHCRRNAHPSQIVTQHRRYASERTDALPLAERVRRKLWKGKPPGPENVDDLYGGPGAIETMFKERKERKMRARPVNEVTEPQAPASNPQENIQTSEPEGEEKRILSTPYQPISTQNETVIADGEAGEVPEYQQAITWDGVPVLGHKGYWKEMPAKPQDEYTTWLHSPIRTEWNFSELVSLMHQAIVECYMCQSANISNAEVSRFSAEGPIPTEELNKAAIHISQEGTVTSVESISKLLSSSLPASAYRETPEIDENEEYTYEESEALIARTEPPMTPLEPRLLYTPSNTSFLDATLKVNAKSALTLMILKRFAHLTNHTIPDPFLSDLASQDPTRNTIRALLTSMAEKTKVKPANVAEQLMNNEELLGESNLLILGRRETPVDKEKEVGRWKVIEQELKSRGLPVFGRLEVQR